MPETAFDRPPLPKFKPPHPAFVGKSKVLSLPAHLNKNLDGPSYSVDLSAGTCTCTNGKAFQWHIKHQEWAPNQACSHKIRMMADILEKAGRPTDMQIAYAKQVSSRYNRYEVVSAFHKELRRGAIEQAVFWGTVLANFRGVPGVLKYMLNILYEETREHWLGQWLLDKYLAKDDNAYEYMLYGIALFCRAPKKWELSHRMEILEAEMRGYEKLVKKYGREVAKAGDFIPIRERDQLLLDLKAGLADGDLALMQYGLKGLQKSKCTNIDAHRAWIMNECMRFIKDQESAAILMGYVQHRANAGLGVGYHELNMFMDFVSGKDAPCRSVQVPAWGKRILDSKPPLLRLGVVPTIPIYAQDNHTWAGKALIRQFPNEFAPGVKQEHYDLRLCGAYMGVVYRHLAFKQFGRIDCEWEEVLWPKWLHDTVSNLWY